MDTFANLLDGYCRLDTAKIHQPITAKASKTKHADIYLFGVIGGDTANLDQFKRDLDKAGNADTITVYLNTVENL